MVILMSKSRDNEVSKCWLRKENPLVLGEMLKYEYMEPLGLTQQELASAKLIHSVD